MITKPASATLKIVVKSLDNYPVPNAQIIVSYKLANKTITHGPYYTLLNGTSTIQLPLNASVTASLNVSFRGVLVAKENKTLIPNTTQNFVIVSNIVNVTYAVKSPFGGLFTSSEIEFQGEPNTSVSSVKVTLATPNGSVLLPVGVYNVSAFHGPLFFTKLFFFNLSNKNVNIIAPLLTLYYKVLSVNHETINAQNVAILSGNSLLSYQSGSEGSFSSLLPGYYEVIAYANGLTNETTISLGKNETINLILPIGYTVQLLLTDFSGSPLKSYTTILSGPINESATTLPNGIAIFKNLPLGTYTLKIYKNSTLIYVTTITVDSSGEQVINLPIVGQNGETITQLFGNFRYTFGVVLLLFAALILTRTRLRKESP
ncbi:hypothetical protein B9Q00_05480 [Candidatus Marsarchaeota G1 archaeon OSP_C]|jgi:hypothetical protein|nr:MAG: hypothetical protein B9Q00_05480 [Candidatus Marsarchaeota G1 archaeon OSP_C]